MPSQRFRRALAGLALAGSIALFPSPAAAGLLDFGKGERAGLPAVPRGLLTAIVDFLRSLTTDDEPPPPPSDHTLGDQGATVDPNGGSRVAVAD